MEVKGNNMYNERKQTHSIDLCNKRWQSINVLSWIIEDQHLLFKGCKEGFKDCKILSAIAGNFDTWSD